ncbi:acetylserotonin O-methyltransferase-like isoform X2 [Rhinatrema bivittatum]|uniref:acetylserotonin O-methyltransferase-like isoform X2 n=1 Tax=Rhinatrema bivittatum TaxID=194408 RepID=UPI0011292175|nr:acetylserotonin O-methyltransferase-like isoform X2 [Rhinatrema bivittatum]
MPPELVLKGQAVLIQSSLLDDIRTQTMFTACELGVFDLLLEPEVPLSSAVIAQHLGSSVDGMERLLSACVGLKLLEVDLKNEEAFYRNTELSSLYLTKSSPKSLYHNMMYYSQSVYLCWHYLTDAVREGEKQFGRDFGVSSKKVFDAFYRSEEELITFMHCMDSLWHLCKKDVLTLFDLSLFPNVCDLGGCSGVMAKECISLYPASTVTIYDLPKVVETAKKHFISPDEHRIRFQEGDFFEDSIPESDLYILARIIHIWTEKKCLQLLEKVYKACKPGGAVLLLELLLNEDRTGPVPSQLQSLNMLLLTEGKERTPAEYSKLLTAVGFKEIQVRTSGKMEGAILGRK